MSRHPLDRVSRRPVTCIWEITRACNLRCIHCENFGGEIGNAELSFDDLLKTADSLAELGCRMVDITGGEPLLHPKWDLFAAALHDRGLRVSLITNGTMLDEERLGRAVAAGIEVIAISVDGLKDVHNRIRKRPGLRLFGLSPFELTMANLTRSVKTVCTKVITQINVLNIDQLPQMREMLGNVGVEDWQLQLAIPTGRILELEEPFVIAPSRLDGLTAFIVEAQADGRLPHIDTSDTIGYYTKREILLRKRRSGQGVWLGCQAGVRAVAITYDGKVRGCSILPPEFDAGDLHDEPFADIWNDKKRFAYSTLFDPKKLTGDCAKCSFGGLCRAGCTSMAYYSTGTIYNNPYCISRPSIPTTESDDSSAEKRACGR